jgi:hypothetical protein
MGRFAERRLGKAVGAGIAEAASEDVTELLQIGIDKGLYDKYVSIPEALNRLARAGVLGAGMGGIAGAIIPEPTLPEGAFDESVAQGVMPEQAPGAAWAAPPTSERDLANVFAPPGGLLNLEQPSIGDLSEIAARAQQGVDQRQTPFIGPDLMSEDLPLWPGGPQNDPNLQPQLPLGTMPPPDSTGSRAPEAAGGTGTAPIPPATQGTALPKQLAALSSALREPAESRIARLLDTAMAQMQVPAKEPSTRDAEAGQRMDETVAHFARQENEQRDKVQNLATLSSKLREPTPPPPSPSDLIDKAMRQMQAPAKESEAGVSKLGKKLDNAVANVEKPGEPKPPPPPSPPAPPAPPAPSTPAPASAPQAAPAVSPAQETTDGAGSPIVQARSTQHLAASVPAAVQALKDPTQYTTIDTPKGPVRLVNVGDDTADRVIHAFDEKGNVVGTMMYSTEQGRDHPHAAVVPERQRQGIASAMYDLAEKTGGVVPPASAEGQART